MPFSVHGGNGGFKSRWEAGDSAVTVLRSESAERRKRVDRWLARQRVLVGLWVLAVMTFAISAAQAHAAKDPQPQPPPLSTTRYGEDYAYLRDPAARTGAWWESFKCLPITGTKGKEEVYLTTGLELRARYEHYNNNLWGGASEPDDGYLWLRAMPLADLHLGSHVRLF